MPSGYKNFDMAFNIDEGYFIFDKLSINTTIGINYSKITESSTTTEGSTIAYYTQYMNGRAYLMPYSKTTSTTTPSRSFSSTAFTYGVGLKYYLGNKFTIGASLLSSKVKGADASTSAYFQVGYVKFLTKQIAFEPSVGYIMGIGDAGAKALQGRIGVGFYLNR